MSGFLLKAARESAKKIITSGGFEENLILKTPDGVIELEMKGIHTKHWRMYDTEANPVNSKNSHLLISEKDLIDNEYPYRLGVNGNVSLVKHKVSVKDSSGFVRNFVVTENYPSETFGLIELQLGDSKI